MRLALVGADGDHGEDLIRLFNVDRRHPGWSVTQVVSDGADRGPDLARRYALPLAPEPAAVLDAVDAALVLPRAGRRHLPLARPFLRAGHAVFVDKPFAASVADAEAMIELAHASGAVLASGSALRWLPALDEAVDAARAIDPVAVTASGPVDPFGPYDGGFFYGAHAVELAYEMAGRLGGAPVGPLTPGAVSAACGVLTGRCGPLTVSACLVAGDDVPFHLQILGRAGVVERSLELPEDYLAPLVDAFVAGVTGQRWPLPADQLVEPVRALAAYQDAVEAERLTPASDPGARR